ncbi:Hypothetical protein PHPALM_210 [Phytophthora palmivora]|uniref:Uncharacterized protein n=1 Tax=Phytophthora palmivora TaxID=4796 RepID=A0A2P4YVE9_9STRA|nr:Hypothetical protein PHPALM_210 [Phytophthora palmivora]
MVAIPVSKLPYEELCFGDTIEYYLMVFGRGNPEGFRRSKIVKIQPGEDHPVHVDTGDTLWKLMKVTRVETASGHAIPRADRISHCALSFLPSSIQPISITNGMHFTSATLALYQVQANVLPTMKSVKIQRRGGVDSRIVCSGAANGGSCPFFVQLYKRRTGMWVISSMCLAHMDCVSVAKPTTKQIAQLPTFVSAVNADNTLSASALIALCHHVTQKPLYMWIYGSTLNTMQTSHQRLEIKRRT